MLGQYSEIAKEVLKMNLTSWYLFFSYYPPNKKRLFPIQMTSFCDLRNTVSNAFKEYFQAYPCNCIG